MDIKYRPGPPSGGSQLGYDSADIYRVNAAMIEGIIKPATIGDMLDVACVAAREGWGDQADRLLALAIQMADGNTAAVINAE